MDRHGDASSLERHVSDVLECLAAANHELNGPVPSEPFERQNEAVIIDLAVAMSNIISEGLGYLVSWPRSGRFPSDAGR